MTTGLRSYRRRRVIGWLLIGLGLVTPCAIALRFADAGIPYQDPPPEIVAQQARYEHIADIATRVGGLVGLALIVAGCWLVIRSRRVKSNLTTETSSRQT